MSNSFSEFLARLHNQDDIAAKELFMRFTNQLIALALRHIDAGLRHKMDPEDVVQSAYKSFFVRYGAGNLDLVNWNSLWGLLSLITVRKCAERAAYHRAECRDAAREVPPPWGEEAVPWPEPFDREPTPLEAAVLSETVEQLFADLDEEERPILELSLQGYTTREISERLGRAERTVRLLREGVRHRLERMQRMCYLPKCWPRERLKPVETFPPGNFLVVPTKCWTSCHSPWFSGTIRLSPSTRERILPNGCLGSPVIVLLLVLTEASSWMSGRALRTLVWARMSMCSEQVGGIVMRAGGVARHAFAERFSHCNTRRR
jgi:RNA polymerase sigma-70 factor (ECF subfamily)